MDPTHPFATTFFFKKRPDVPHGQEHDTFMVRDLDTDTRSAGARERVLRDLVAFRRGAPTSATVPERGDDYAVLRWAFDAGRDGVSWLTMWLGLAADRCVILYMVLHVDEDEEVLPQGVAARLDRMREDPAGVSGSSLKELIDHPEYGLRFEG